MTDTKKPKTSQDRVTMYLEVQGIDFKLFTYILHNSENRKPEEIEKLGKLKLLERVRLNLEVNSAHIKGLASTRPLLAGYLGDRIVPLQTDIQEDLQAVAEEIARLETELNLT